MNRHQTRAIVRIREMILRGELAAGARVAEAPLAQLLGMSRTPVRQALPVLAQEGLLTEHETRGYVVRGLSATDILDAIDLRGVLEGLAARRVAERGASRTLLQALRVCLADGDQILAEGHVADKAEALYVEMNVRFHQLIVLECRSAIIQQALERNARIPFAGPQALAVDKTSLQRMHETLGCAQAVAQEIQEVVVTAERREEKLQDVPIAVSAFTSEALQSRALADIHALGNLTPSVNLDSGAPFSGDRSVLSDSIRGIGQDDFAFNLNPGVGV